MSFSEFGLRFFIDGKSRYHCVRVLLSDSLAALGEKKPSRYGGRALVAWVSTVTEPRAAIAKALGVAPQFDKAVRCR
jgi:hypothetical protein